MYILHNQVKMGILLGTHLDLYLVVAYYWVTCHASLWPTILEQRIYSMERILQSWYTKN